jgi:hypothetical protein
MGNRSLTLGWLLAARTLAVLPAIGQPDIHTFSGIETPANSTGHIQLTLSCQAPRSVQTFFDIYPVERSADLQSWEPSLLVVRTNASTNLLQVEFASSSPAAFVRMPTNQFITHLPKPTGPYAVGVMNRLLTARPNRRSVLAWSCSSTDTCLDWMITCWTTRPTHFLC